MDDEAIGLMEMLDKVLHNATKKKDKGEGGDGAVVQQPSTRTGGKSSIRSKIEATVFTNTTSREKSFPRPAGKCGRVVPPNYLWAMVGHTKKMHCAHVLLYFWYKLTKSQQEIARDLFKGLEKIDKARQKIAEKQQKKRKADEKKAQRQSKKPKTTKQPVEQPKVCCYLYCILCVVVC